MGVMVPLLGICTEDPRKASCVLPAEGSASRRSEAIQQSAELTWPGAVGAAITSSLLEQGWLMKAASARALEMTKQGEQALRMTYDLDIGQLEWLRTG